MIKKYLKTIFLFASLMAVIGNVNAQRKMENLGRGVVAVRSGASSAFVSWRLLGTDPQSIGFNIYRSTGGGAAVMLNGSPLTGGTNYTDNTADLTQDNAYFVKPVLNGTEQASSSSFTLTANHAVEPCVVVPLRSGSNIHLVSVGDLDGDGEYEFVIDRLDFINGGCKLEAYMRDGTFLWQVDLGPNSKNMDNISPGSSTIDVGNWDGFTVYDMDGDGKAEVMVRTANGVIFGDGTVLTNSNDNIQFVSILNGMTGAERARIQIPNEYISTGPLACSFGIGYLNGITPSLVAFMKNRNADGSFNRLMCTWDFDGTNLTLKWKNNLTSVGASYGSGSDGHQMRILDFDGDGKDDVGEIGFVIKNDGSTLYNLGDQGIYHGDRWHVGKLDPNRPGLQGYGIQQDNTDGLIEYYYDATTGKVLWKHTTLNVGDAGRGEAGDIDPTHPGYEVWSFSGLYNAPSNAQLATSTPYPNFRIWWDGDVLSENLNDGKIEKWNYSSGSVSRLVTTWNYEGATQSDRNAPMFYGDIFGDWREEVVYTDPSYSKLVIFTSPTPTTARIYTLAHNPEYRNSMTVKGYLQSHMLDYYLGAGMSMPPTPPIQTAKCIWKGNYSNNFWDAGITSNWVVNGAPGNYTQYDDVMFDISAAPDTLVQLTGSLTPSSVKVITPINYTFGGTGTISGLTGILKSGNGSLTLSTNCDYTDTTRVEQGSFFVNANLSQSPVLVYFRATVGGSGTFSQLVTLNQGAIVSPGAKRSTGTVTFASGLTLPANSSCMFDITDDSTGLIKPSDKIIITGNLVVSDTMTIQINKINGKVKAGTYPLISYTGSFFGNLAKIGISGLFGQKFALTNVGGVISLTIEAARGAAKIVWNGTSDTWDLQTTPAWLLNGLPVTFVPNDTVVFNQNGSNNPAVKVNGTLTVGDISVETSQTNYSFTGTGNIGGTTNLTKNGAGTLAMLTTNSFTGKTVINSGRFEVNSLADAGAPSSIGADTAKSPMDFVLNNAYLKYAGLANISTNKGLTINGTNDTIEVTNSGKLMTLQGLITGTANLVKTGAGTLNLQKTSNTFTGNTTIKGGILSLGDEIANTNGLNTGSLTFDGGALTMYSSSSTYTKFYTNFIVPVGSTGTVNTDVRCNYYGTLTGGGTLSVYLPGTIDRTIFFGDWSAFTGAINVTGVVSSKFRIANAFGYAAATINLGDNTALYHGGTGQNGGDGVATTVNIGALSGTSSSNIFEENWVIGAKNVDATFNGSISGNSITKTGTGSWTLTNANTYTGGTIINGGTLFVNNTIGSGTGIGTVTVNNSGILAGTGNITGAITVNSGGSIAPGINAIGTLSAANVIFTIGSSLTMEVNNTLNTKDMISSSGTIRLAGTLNIAKLDAGAFASGNTYKIFNANSIIGSFTSITPATPGAWLAWDTTTLRTNGTIKIRPSQTITFGTLADKTFGDASFNLTATSSSGLPVTYTSSDPSVITISGNTVTMVSTGNVTITASQPGDATYLPADNVTQTLAVNKASQTITFNDLISKKVGDAPFNLTATSSSGLTVTYESSNVNVATISGSTLTIVGAGSTNITASQVGNDNYNPAVDVTKALDVINTSTSFLFAQDIVIAPNPVTDYLRITIDRPDIKAEISIYTLSGVQLYHQKIADKNTIIPMTQFKPGMYMVKIISDEGSLVKQIIMQ